MTGVGMADNLIALPIIIIFLEGGNKIDESFYMVFFGRFGNRNNVYFQEKLASIQIAFPKGGTWINTCV